MADDAIVHAPVDMTNDRTAPSGETVRMVNAEGHAYDIPKEMAAKAAADGLKHESSFTDILSDLPGYTLPGRIASNIANMGKEPGADLHAQGLEVLIGKDGGTYVMPREEVNDAIVKGGMRRPDMVDQKERELVAGVEAKYDPQNQGARGDVKQFVGGLQSEFTKTASWGLLDPEKDAQTATQRAASESAAEGHELAEGAGKGVGFVAGIAADPLSVGSVATKAGVAAERRVFGEAVAQTSRGVASKVAGGVVKGVTEGAIMSAPKAAHELLDGNPEAAGEALLFGIGAGAFVGGGGSLLGHAKKAAAEAAASKGEALVEAGEAKLSRLAGEEVAQGAAEKALDKGAQKAVTKGVEHTAAAIGGAVGGLPGYVVGKGVGSVLAGKAEAALEGEAAQRLLAKTAKAIGERLEGIGPALERMAQSGAPQAMEMGSLNAISQLIGAKEKMTRQGQYEAVRDRLAELNSQPEQRAQQIGDLASGLGDGPHRDAYNAKANAALDYLQGQLPKQPTKPGLFQPRQNWSPTEKQMASFERKVQVVSDPFSVIDELAKGTLTQDHVEALKAVYPALAFEFRERVLNKAADPKAPELSKQQRAKLELLLGMPLSDSSDPKSVAMYQSFYKKDPEAMPKAGKAPAMPGAQATPAQQIAGRV